MTLQGSEEPGYKAILDTCGDYEYDGSLFVDRHFYAVISPQEKAVAAGCPFLVAHAAFGPDQKSAVKEIMVWTDKEEGESVFGSDQDGSLPVGTFKLSDILHAYEETDPSTGDTYDVITNSCANFVVGLGSKLDVNIDSQMKSFVTRRLAEVAGKELHQDIRESLAYYSLFGGHHLRADAVTDEEAIELLVNQYASKFT